MNRHPANRVWTAPPETPPLPRVDGLRNGVQTVEMGALDRILVREDHEFASLFSSGPWMAVLRGTYGFDVKTSILVEDGEITAAVPYCEIEDIRGPRLISLPFSDYVDPIAGDPDTWRRLVQSLLDRQAPVRFRCLRNPIGLSDPRFTASSTALWHAADLTRPEAEIWSMLKDNARQNIRRAERAGIVVHDGGSIDDVRTFYDLHCGVRKNKYRMFAQPWDFFANIFEEFSRGDCIRVLLAKMDGEAIAGILFLIQGNRLYYKFNASRDTEHRPNDLLVWSGMRLGRSLGLTSLDFGISDVDQPGLVRFKRKFASEERQIWQLSWAPEGHEDPRGQQAGRMLHGLTAILTDPAVPDHLTRSVGDEIYRFFC